MADFDPDKYLAEKAAATATPGFDPDKYLAEKSGGNPKFSPHVDPLKGVGPWEKALRGAELGLSNIATSLHLNPWAKDLDPSLTKGLLESGSLHSGHLPLIGDYSITPAKIGEFAGEVAGTAPIGGVAAGGARMALARLGLGAAAPGVAGLAARFAPAIVEGSTQGAILGGQDNRALGALMGAGFAGAGSAAADAVGGLARGFVRPTPAAASLVAEGMPLTLGQMAQRGAISKMEEAGLHSAISGGALHDLRQAPREALQRIAAARAVAPGEGLPVGQVRPGDFIDQLAAGYRQAYAPIEATPMPAHYGGVPTAQALREGFGAIASDPSIDTDAATREAVASWLRNQATTMDRAHQFELGGRPAPRVSGDVRQVRPLLPVGELGITAPTSQWAESPLSEVTANGRAPARGPAAEPAPEVFNTARPLLTVRSAIREQLRDPELSTARRRMYSNAEDMVTNALEEQLGPERSAQLRDIDARYANLMAIVRAVNAARGSESGFTGYQLSQAAQQGLTPMAKARGGGGPLRTLGDLANEVLPNKSPQTGALKQTLPLGLNHAAGPMALFLNGPGRNFALGATAPQRAAVTIGELLQSMLPNRSGAGAFLPGPNAYLAPMEVQER